MKWLFHVHFSTDHNRRSVYRLCLFVCLFECGCRAFFSYILSDVFFFICLSLFSKLCVDIGKVSQWTSKWANINSCWHRFAPFLLINCHIHTHRKKNASLKIRKFYFKLMFSLALFEIGWKFVWARRKKGTILRQRTHSESMCVYLFEHSAHIQIVIDSVWWVVVWIDSRFEMAWKNDKIWRFNSIYYIE